MRIKTISSLEKVFIDKSLNDYNETSYISALKGERVSFQIAYTCEEEIIRFELCKLYVKGDLKKYIKIKKVQNVPVEYPVYPDALDDNYLSTKPGLYPDVLIDVGYKSKENPYGLIREVPNNLKALWIDIDVPEDIKAGKHILKIGFESENKKSEIKMTVNIIDCILPKQKLIYTEWFHCDCLANYYNVKVWSKKHFDIIRNFVRTAHNNGINMLLIPVFTPPLDTKVGGERLTTQLVKVIKDGEKYSFEYDLLDKFLDLISSEGIEYYEISHLYTQWGVYHAPKVIAYVDGKKKKIFGWETDSHSSEYVSFLRQFLISFIDHMKKRGEDKKCYYHISDEPNEKHLDSYKQGKDAVYDLLKDYTIMDALSNYEFFEKCIVQTPIPATDHIQPFIDNNVQNLWTYYCCGQCIGVSNRLVSMPSWRNRFIGIQMFKYDIVGFLQWGYNFYNNRFSCDHIIPYLDLSGDNWVPADDPFSVYPNENGEALESIRLKVFYEGINDMRALDACSSLYDKDEVIKTIENIYGKEIMFSDCPKTGDMMIKIRETINKMIEEKVSNEKN